LYASIIHYYIYQRLLLLASVHHTPTACEVAASAITFLATSGLIKALELTFIDSGLFVALIETVANKMLMVDSSSHQLDLEVGGKYRASLP